VNGAEGGSSSLPEQPVAIRVLNVAQAPREPHIHHHREADHIRRSLEVAERIGGSSAAGRKMPAPQAGAELAQLQTKPIEMKQSNVVAQDAHERTPSALLACPDRLNGGR